MSNQLTPLVKFKGYDANNNPLTGGKLYTYSAGGSTPIDTYKDLTTGTPNTNPVILNSRGEADVWLADGLAYKLVLKDSNDVEIWSKDNITGSGGGSGGGSIGSLQEAYNGGSDVVEATETPIRLKAGDLGYSALEVYGLNDSFIGEPRVALANGVDLATPSNNETTSLNLNNLYMRDDTGLKTISLSNLADFNFYMQIDAETYIRVKPNDMILAGTNGVYVSSKAGATANASEHEVKGSSYHVKSLADATQSNINMNGSGNSYSDHIVSGNNNTDSRVGNAATGAKILLNTGDGSNQIYLSDGTDKVSITPEGFYTKGDSESPQDKDGRLIWDSVNNTHVLQVYNGSMADWEDSDLRIDDLTSGPASIHISEAHDMSSGGDTVNFKNISTQETILYARQRIGAHTEVANETVQNRAYTNVYTPYFSDDSGATPLAGATDFISQFTSPITFATFKIEFVLRETVTNEEIVYNAYIGTDDTGPNIVRQRAAISGVSGDTITFDFENDMNIVTGLETYTKVTKRDGTPLQVAISDLSAPYVKAYIRIYEEKGLAFEEESFKSLATGDYLDIRGSYNANVGQFRTCAVVGGRTKLTHIAVPIDQNNLSGGTTAKLRVAIQQIESGVTTTLAQGSFDIDEFTTPNAFVHVPLDSEYQITGSGLDIRLCAGVNDQIGGGTIQFYKGKASALNDYRIAGQFTQLTGTIPTTPTVTNQNDQPLIIAYHNLEKPDFTLPTNAQEPYIYSVGQWVVSTASNFSNSAPLDVPWKTFASSALDIVNADDYSLTGSEITIVKDGTFNVGGNVRFSSSDQRMQAVIEILLDTGSGYSSIGLLFSDSYIRNSGSSSDYWNNSFGGVDLLLNAGDKIKIQIQQERQDASDLTGTVTADQGLLRIERKQ